jgi:hypothetical protein
MIVPRNSLLVAGLCILGRLNASKRAHDVLLGLNRHHWIASIAIQIQGNPENTRLDLTRVERRIPMTADVGYPD